MSDIKLKIQNVVADEATKQITFDFGVDLSSVTSGEVDWAVAELVSKFPLSWQSQKVDSVNINAEWEQPDDLAIIESGSPVAGTQFFAGAEGGTSTSFFEAGSNGSLMNIGIPIAATAGWRHGYWFGYYGNDHGYYDGQKIEPVVDTVEQFAKIATFTVTLNGNEDLPSNVLEVVSFFGSGDAVVDNELQVDTSGATYFTDAGNPASSLTIETEAEEEIVQIDVSGQTLGWDDLADVNHFTMSSSTQFTAPSGDEIEVYSASEVDGEIVVDYSAGELSLSYQGTQPVSDWSDVPAIVSLNSSGNGNKIIYVAGYTAEDTPGDGDSNNGEQNETQPMEEINMSYDFSKDKLGAVTPTIPEPVDGATQTYTDASGAAIPSIANCRTKKFLSVLEAKGLNLCGDLVMAPDAQIYLQDGTSADSLVKEISFAYGKFVTDSGTGEEVFQFADPATDVGSGTDMAEPIVGEGQDDPDDLGSRTSILGEEVATLDDTGVTAGAAGPTQPSHGNKWFMMITRPDGSKEFKGMPMVDDLFDAVNASGRVISILGAAQEVEDLQELLKVILEAETLATEAALEALDDSMRLSFQALRDFVEAMEAALVQHINAGDAEVMAHFDARFEALQDGLVAFEDSTRFHASKLLSEIEDLPSEDACQVGGTFTLSGLPTRATDPSKWMIEVAIQDGTGAGAKRLGDIELEYELVFNGSDMVISTHIGSCDELPSGHTLIANAIYCGSVVDADITHGSDGSMSNAYSAPNTLIDVAAGEETGAEVEGASNPFKDQDENAEGHQPGQAIKVQPSVN